MLVGHGPERERLELQRAEDLGISGHVQFTGALADPADALRAADAFALPSVAEGMSNSLLEAMATGLPCIASAIGGNIDLLDGGVGVLVSGRDPAAWRLARIRSSGILCSPKTPRARSLGQAARRRVEEEYALPVVVDRYLALYRRLLGQSAN